MTSEGVIVGLHYENLKLNSFVHDVEFFDGQKKERTDKVIAKNILTTVDSEGLSLMLMESIPD